MNNIFIPNRFEQITSEWLKDALHSSNNTGAISSIRALKIKPCQSDKGFLGQHAVIEIEYYESNSKPKTVFVKLSSESHEIKEISVEYGFYRREINFYKLIGKDAGVNTPRCYHTDMNSIGDHVLVLEDLSAFENGDRMLGCSVEDALLICRSLAKLHSTWWESPKLENFDWLPDLNQVYDFTQISDTFRSAWDIFKKKVPHISKYIMDLGSQYANHAERVSSHLFQSSPRTLIHFDFHLDNLFFARNENTDLIVVDWQLITRGRGIVDLSLLLCQNLSIDTRREYESNLLETYYKYLIDYGVKNYSYQELLYDYKISLIFHMFGLVFTLGADSFTSEQEKLIIETIIPRNMGAIDDIQAGDVLSMTE